MSRDLVFRKVGGISVLFPPFLACLLVFFFLFMSMKGAGEAGGEDGEDAHGGPKGGV